MTNYTVDSARWSRMNIFEQMGNIYGEVGRSYNAKRSGRVSDVNLATERAIDLFDATIASLVQKKSVQAKEVLRAKDQFLSNLYDEFDEKDASSLEKYFLEFAVAARLNV